MREGVFSKHKHRKPALKGSRRVCREKKANAWEKKGVELIGEGRGGFSQGAEGADVAEAVFLFQRQESS